MYKKSTDGRDQMRRQYNPPPTYGGSRFIRATHGVRGLEDNELAGVGPRGSHPQREGSWNGNARRSVPNGGELLPDFEYFGNNLGQESGMHRHDEGARLGSESMESAEARREADGMYRGSPDVVDRIGHDYDESGLDFTRPAADSAPDASRYAADSAGERDWQGAERDRHGAEHERHGAERDRHGAENGWQGTERDRWSEGSSQPYGDDESERDGEMSGDGRHTRRPVRRGGLFHTDRPMRGRRPQPCDTACVSVPPEEGDSCEVLPPEQKPHPFLNFSVEDGDLLLLVLLALLAGEEGCADLVATFALLLMIR